MGRTWGEIGAQSSWAGDEAQSAVGAPLTRGEFLMAAGLSAAGALVLGTPGFALADRANSGSWLAARAVEARSSSVLRFQSRPDLRPPRVRIVGRRQPDA